MEYLFLLIFLLYLAPWVFAESIEHRSSTTILFLNLGLGWTGVGWLAAAGWVYRDWPREVAPPELVLVRPGEESRPSPARRALVPGLASLALVAGVALIARSTPTEVAPEWAIAEVDRATARVHLGAGTDWPEVGSLGSRCRVRVLEREGGWMRVWRLDGCDEVMSGRSGWVRMEALRPAPDATRQAAWQAARATPDPRASRRSTTRSIRRP